MRRVSGFAGLALAWLAILSGTGWSATQGSPATRRVISHFINQAAGQVLADVGISNPQISPGDSCDLPGDGVQDYTDIHFRVIWPDTVFVSVLIRVEGGQDLGAIQSSRPRGPGQVVTTQFDGCLRQNNVNTTLADGRYVIRVRALTEIGPEEMFDFPIEIDRLPPLVVSLRETSGNGVFRNGDTIVLELVTDRPGYTVVPDFKNLDSDTDPTLTSVVDHGDNSYTIRHNISEQNTVLDRSGLRIPIKITDQAGNTRTDRSTSVCLLNHPPRLLLSRMLSERNVFKNGDTIRVETRWDSPNAPLTVTADFGNIDNHYQPGLVSVTERSGNVFELAYPLSSQNTKLDYTDYRLRITAQDAGCGTATDTSVVLQLDNQAPPKPAVDPVPATTRISTLALSGFAPGADRIEVRRNNVAIASTTPEADDRFNVNVPLVISLNTLVVTALDLVGNRSAPDTLRITLEAPLAPIVNPLPNSTREASVTVSGRAPNAAVVRVLHGSAIVATDSSIVDGQFAMTVPLSVGRNELKVEAVNNLSQASVSTTISIFRLSEAFLTVPSRFVPGSAGAAGQFLLGLDRTARSVRVELWSLSGDLISVLEDQTPRDLYTLTWNGRDADGRSVQGGPILSRFDINYVDGSKETMTKAFVLVNQ